MDLEEAFDYFVGFGTILDRESRAVLIKHINRFLADPVNKLVPKEKEEIKIQPYFETFVDIVTNNPNLLSFMKDSPTILSDVLNDCLSVFSEAHHELITNDALNEEKELLEQWKEVGMDVFNRLNRSTGVTKKRKEKKEAGKSDIRRNKPKLKENDKKVKGREVSLFDVLSSKYYSEDEMSYNFFEKKNLELTNERTEIEEGSQQLTSKSSDTKKDQLAKLRREKAINTDEFTALRKRLFGDWETLWQAKYDRELLRILDEKRKILCEELYKRIEQLKKIQDLLSPFTDRLGRFWDLSQTSLKQLNFNVLEHYASLLEQEEALQELSELLGRLELEELEIEYEEVQSFKPSFRYEYTPHSKSEIVGIHEGEDLNNLLSSEIAFFADEDLEWLFYTKFAEKKLLVYDFMGKSPVLDMEPITETVEKSVGEKMGPAIICVDTSGSMHGPPERIAKTLCFAILRSCLLGDRRCYLISFSTRITTLELTDLNSGLPSLINFLSLSFHGGTDGTPALDAALNMLQTKDFKNADVLMISDFIMAKPDDKTVERIEEQKEKKTKFYSLTISKTANPGVMEIFDSNFAYDTSNPASLKDSVIAIKQIVRKQLPELDLPTTESS